MMRYSFLRYEPSYYMKSSCLLHAAANLQIAHLIGSRVGFRDSVDTSETEWTLHRTEKYVTHLRNATTKSLHSVL